MIESASLKISSFCIVTKDLNEPSSFLLFNCKLKKWAALNDLNKRLIDSGQFHRLKKDLLYELINKGILVPENQDEKNSLIERLKVFDKLTIVIDNELDDQFIHRLNSFANLHKVTQLAFLFINPDKEHINILSFLKQRTVQNTQFKKIRYFTLKFSLQDQDYLSLSEYKDDKKNIAEQIHKQHLIKEGALKSSFEEDNITQYSCNTYKEDFFKNHFPKINFFRNTYSLSLINSSFAFLKELPFSGLVCDSSVLKKTTGSLEINTACENCILLIGCGGYTADQRVVCPSYKNTIPHYINHFTRHDHGTEEKESPYFGVKNRINIKKQVDILLESIICTNSAAINRPYLNIVIEENNDAFKLSKSNLPNMSVLCAKEADRMASVFKENSFEQDFIQTSCTLVKSYLEYKKKNYAASSQIIERGIQHAINLLSYPNAEIAFLVVYQMLTNKAKVALFNKNLTDWKKYTLECIHLILNSAQPASCPEMDFSQFHSLSTAVLNATVMETIERILLMNIKDPQFEPGENLILSIMVNNEDNLLNTQIYSWVKLLKEYTNSNEIYYLNSFNIFMHEENQLINIKPLKIYLKSYLKKHNPLFLKKPNILYYDQP